MFFGERVWGPRPIEPDFVPRCLPGLSPDVVKTSTSWGWTVEVILASVADDPLDLLESAPPSANLTPVLRCVAVPLPPPPPPALCPLLRMAKLSHKLVGQEALR